MRWSIILWSAVEYSGGEREGMVRFEIGRLVDWRGEAGRKRRRKRRGTWRSGGVEWRAGWKFHVKYDR